MDIRSLLRSAIQRLEAASVPDAKTDAEYLLASVLRMDRLQMKADSFREVSPADEERFAALIRRREKREPLQYILGDQYFMSLPFRVRPGVLIPRFDTETLCEQVIRQAPTGARVLDLCTGSGALAVAVKKHRPDTEVTASDLSPDALSIARENALLNQVDITFLQGDLFAAVGDSRFDCILSNPPYIPDGEKESLQKEVLFEPEMALFGGEDGLDFYRRIIREAPAHLYPRGTLFLEIGDTQTEAVSALLEKDFTFITVYHDLNPLPRAVKAVLKG